MKLDDLVYVKFEKLPGLIAHLLWKFRRHCQEVDRNEYVMTYKLLFIITHAEKFISPVVQALEPIFYRRMLEDKLYNDKPDEKTIQNFVIHNLRIAESKLADQVKENISLTIRRIDFALEDDKSEKENHFLELSTCDPGFQEGIWLSRMKKLFKEIGIEYISEKVRTRYCGATCVCVRPCYIRVYFKATKLQLAVLKLLLSPYSGADVIFGAGRRELQFH